jgi:small subunit ribosomal protein S20
MANHKSALKRIRQTEKKRLHNRYYAKTMRSALRKLRAAKEKAVAEEMLPKVQKMLDKLAKKNMIHWKKAANLKSGAMKFVAKLA